MALDPSPANTSRATRRWWPPSTRFQIASATLLALAVVLIAIFDWNWFKRPVEWMVQSSTGRSFQIQGDLRVSLGNTTTVQADGVRLGNADWATDEEAWMAQASRVQVSIRPWPLLLGRVRIPDVRLSQPVVLLQANPDDKGGNWDFGRRPRDGEPRWRLERLWVDDGHLRFVDTASRTDLQLGIASREPRREDAAPPVGIDGGGTWRGSRFTLEGVAESPLALAQADDPYRISLRASAGATHATARGALVNPFQFRHFDLQLALRGQDLEDLYPLVGLALPPTAAYNFDGRLRRAGDIWHYTGFEGTVGKSDLSGDVRVDVTGDRPHFHARLHSDRLDFDDLSGFVGAAPDEPDPAPDRLFPQTPYELAKLRAMDADVAWKAARVDAPPLPMDDMDAHLLLEGGLLRLEPLNLGIAGGEIRSTIRMDARSERIDTTAVASVRGIELARLMPNANLAEQAVGRIGGQIDLRGNGNSIAAILGSANGDVAIGMGPGKISNLVMELAGLDIAEALRFLLTGDRQVPIRCAFADFDVVDGVMTTESLAFDTTDTILIGEGDISLRDETLDLLLRPRPKDRSILALRSPLRISGSFVSPSFRPDLAALGLRGAVALTLASIAPPAGLLATIEPGPGEDSDCGGEYAR
ncbi:AsmA family protein [Luteimonas aestuarii]|uniref:AsmA family protein n=1 Tax=Luteimonas aestuarii TaxID=453837 RepID=A0A4R5TTU4_9GAMM|nr:AsmA family protein [Luteimonas aestuarii]TDK24446.1 AsmA family protein [Luteimonas aestuarii]